MSACAIESSENRGDFALVVLSGEPAMDYDVLVFPELLAYYDTSLVSSNVI